MTKIDPKSARYPRIGDEPQGLFTIRKPETTAAARRAIDIIFWP
jgi:hypothetical protein